MKELSSLGCCQYRKIIAIKVQMCWRICDNFFQIRCCVNDKLLLICPRLSVSIFITEKGLFIIVPRFAEVFGFKLCLTGRSVNDAGKSKIIDIVSSIMGV